MNIHHIFCTFYIFLFKKCRWVGDCEGAIFVGDHTLQESAICQTTDSQYIDFAELEFINKTHDGNKIPSFLSVGNNNNHFNRHAAADACSMPHTLMESKPILALEKTQVSQLQKEQKNTLDRAAERESEKKPLMYVVQLSAKPHSLGDQNAQREYELAQIESQNALLEIEVAFLNIRGSPWKHLMDIRFKNSIQPTRALGDIGITAGFGTLRYPSIMKIPLQSLIAGGKRATGKKFLALCSDGAFSNWAFANMGALTHFLASPLHFFRTHFYHAKQEMVIRLINSEKFHFSDFFNVEYDATTSTTPRGEEGLMARWRACKSWNEAITFIKTHHWEAVCSHAYQKTFLQSEEAPPPPPLQTSTTTATATKNTTNQTNNTPFAMQLLSMGPHVPPFFMPHSLFHQPAPAQPEKMTVAAAAASTDIIITDDPVYLAWREALRISIAWLVENVSVDEPNVLTMPLSTLAQVAAHMAVVMGSFDNVTILVAKL